MSLPKHLDEAAARMKDAATRIELAREQPVSLETLRGWVAAVSDFCLALSDVHSFNNESVHEELHALEERVGIKQHPLTGRKGHPQKAT